MKQEPTAASRRFAGGIPTLQGREDVKPITLPFAEWLPRQRWYAGRNRRQTAVSAAAITALRADLELVLLDVSYADGSTERYQVVVLWSAEKRTDYPDIATIGAVRGRTAYDALYDAASVRHLLELCGAGATRGDVAFSVEPGSGCPSTRRRGSRVPSRAIPAWCSAIRRS